MSKFLNELFSPVNEFFYDFFKFVLTRLNISGTNCLVNLKIYQNVARGTLSIATKFHGYNCRGWGEIRNFGFPFSFGNISDANGFVRLKIDQAICHSARDI